MTLVMKKVCVVCFGILEVCGDNGNASVFFLALSVRTKRESDTDT